MKPNRFLLCALTLAASMATASDYSAVVGVSASSGYKTSYAPANLSTDPLSNEVTLTTSVGNYTPTQWRLFAPPGTKRMYVSFTTYAVDQDARAAARFGTTPTSSYAEVTAEAAASNNYSRTLQTLYEGQEMRFYSPGRSGVLTISQPLSTDTFKTTNGGWVYFNVLSLPQGAVLNLQTRIVVDSTCYNSWYTAAQWDAADNPAENATHTCSGSTGGTTTPTNSLTGISISPTQLTAGSTATATISPTPSTAGLGTCSSSSGLVSISSNKVSLVSPGPTSDTTVTITCNGKSTSLTVKAATTPSVLATESQASDGTLVLSVPFTPTASDAGKTAKVWIAARIPANKFFFTEDLWFFKRATPRSWEQLALLDMGSVTFNSAMVLAMSQNLSIETGLTKADLQAFGVELHLGYQTSGGAFVNLGQVWK